MYAKEEQLPLARRNVRFHVCEAFPGGATTSPPSVCASGWGCTTVVVARLGLLGTTRVETATWLAPTSVALATVPTRPLVALVAVPEPVTVVIAVATTVAVAATTVLLTDAVAATTVLVTVPVPVPVTVVAVDLTTVLSSDCSPFPYIALLLKVGLYT